MENKIMQLAILLSLFLFFGNHLFSQVYSSESKIAELRLKLETKLTDSARLQTLADLSLQYASNKKDSALYFANELADLAKKERNKKMTASAFSCKGTIYFYATPLDSSLINYQKALTIFTASNDTTNIIKNTMNIGNVYYSIGFNNLDTSYLYKSLFYYNTALAMCTSKYPAERSQIYNNIGNVYSEIAYHLISVEYLDTVIHYLNKSLEIKSQIFDTIGIINTLLNIGGQYSDKGEALNEPIYLNRALTYYFESVKYRKELGDTLNLHENYINIGSTYRKLGVFDSAFYYLFKGFENAKNVNNIQSYGQYFVAIHTLYAQLGDFESAYKVTLDYISVKDSLSNVSVQLKIAEFEKRYEQEKVNKENIELKRKIEKQSRINFVTIFGLIIFVLISVFLILELKLSKAINQIYPFNEFEINKLDKLEWNFGLFQLVFAVFVLVINIVNVYYKKFDLTVMIIVCTSLIAITGIVKQIYFAKLKLKAGYLQRKK